MENKKFDEKFLKKTFPENYKISIGDALHYKLETPFLDDFKANITLHIALTDPPGKISISDKGAIFGNLGYLHKKAIESMKTCVNQRFPVACHFAANSGEKELVYEVEIAPNDRWFAEKLRFAVNNFISLLSKIYGFVEISGL